MARAHAQRKAVAWLAVLAAGLLLFAPSVSRMLMPASMDMTMGAMCGEHGTADPHSGGNHHADLLDVCAYCTLVSHGGLPLHAVAFSVPAIPAAPAAALACGRSVVAIAVERLPARGPPAACA